MQCSGHAYPFTSTVKVFISVELETGKPAFFLPAGSRTLTHPTHAHSPHHLLVTRVDDD